MRVLVNHLRGSGMPDLISQAGGDVSIDPGPVLKLLERCPDAAVTPLVDDVAGAAGADVGRLWLKDERNRMGQGSFKALGAAYVVASDAAATETGRLDGTTYVAASAGNHGLSLATGARIFGARSVIYIADTVPEPLAKRLVAAGAEVRRAGADYEESMAAAADAAADEGWVLLSDSTWPGYYETARRVMEGYTVIANETVQQIPETPTHIFLQAGVGGLAAALAAYFRHAWGDAPKIVVVEPESARPLLESIRAGEPVRADGPTSTMGRLDCKEASHLALASLARTADLFVTIEDAEAAVTVDRLSGDGFPTTPSGGGGVTALEHADRDALGIDHDSRILAVLSEGPL